MTDYYVRTTGLDGTSGHDGTTPAKAWLTLGYAMTNVAAGSTIWVGSGTYRVSAVIAPTSMASMTYLYGDVDGSHTGDAGEVVVTNYTSDTSVGSACHVFAFATKDYWTLGSLTIINGAASSAYAAVSITAETDHITLRDCTIYSYQKCVSAASLNFGVALNLTIERCRMFGLQGTTIAITAPASATGADSDLATLIRNSVLIGSVTVTGANNTYRSGGITVANCFILGGFSQGTNYVSTTYPVAIYNSFVTSTVACSTAGLVLSDYNLVLGGFTTVTPGANDIVNGNRNWRFSLGHEGSFGGTTRPFGEFPAGSPLLTYGSSASVIVADDINGVTRPASGASQGSNQKALGPYERRNSGVMDQSVYNTSPPSVRIDGPGYHEFPLAVSSNRTTTVSAYMRYTAAYGGPQLPALYVVNGTEAGVAVGSNVMTAAPNVWQQVTYPFAATSNGVVTVRAVSFSSNGPGSMYVDDLGAS
jgi:hypothetical protein